MLEIIPLNWETWLFLHLMFKLWFTVILYQTCVQGDSCGGIGKGREGVTQQAYVSFVQ